MPGPAHITGAAKAYAREATNFPWILSLMLFLLLVELACALVVDLKQNSIQQFLNDNKVSLVEFYAPWCSYCKSMAPEYESAAIELENVVKLARVNCDEESMICAKYGVVSYPTLKVFHYSDAFEYSGDRGHSSIVNVMLRQVAPTVTQLTNEKLEYFKSRNQVVVIAGTIINSPEYNAFHAVAERLHNEYMFGMIESSTSSITLYKRFDERKDVFTGSLVSEVEITQFIKMFGEPLVPEIGISNFDSIMQRGKPIGYFLHYNDEQRQKFEPVMEELAKNHKNIQFVFLDSNLYPGFVNNLALRAEWPAFAIRDERSGSKYPFDQFKTLTGDALTNFVRDYSEGKIAAMIKSEPIPIPNDGPVKIVVGTTFDTLVKDTSKDVFIEFYSPQCIWCKRLEPIYKELGESLRNIQFENIVIAKIDATINETPIRIQGYPTMILFKANSNEMVLFEGERSIEHFHDFLFKNAVYGRELKAAITLQSQNSKFKPNGKQHRFGDVGSTNYVDGHIEL